MAEWKRFCCAVDFSDPSRVAMREAAELARRFGGELELLHVHPLSAPAVDLGALPPPPDVLETVLRELRGTLASWQEEAAKIAGHPVNGTVVPGIPADDIGRFAGERRMDVVVVGSHGRKGLARLLLGSVAERVAREAPCAVVVSRHRESHRSP
jgi:nucleotide-binding universal stress UspA family protein